jgi:hypothetical protein
MFATTWGRLSFLFIAAVATHLHVMAALQCVSIVMKVHAVTVTTHMFVVINCKLSQPFSEHGVDPFTTV